MGFTHALSAVAVVAVILVFAPNFMFWVIGTTSIPLLVLALFTIAGGALVPDLDNTRSTAESALGPLGNAVSTCFRASSLVFQTAIRTPKDDSKPNPHRGAWHSPIFCTILAFLVYLGAIIPHEVNIPYLNKSFTIGEIFVVLFTSTIILIGFSALFKKGMKAIRNKGGEIFGDLLAFLTSFAFTVALYSQRPDGLSVMWLPASFYIGMVIHHLGDGFTTMGNPFLAPIPYKGKCWWNFRIPPHIKAGGAAENYFFIPMFSVIILLAVIRIMWSFLA